MRVQGVGALHRKEVPKPALDPGETEPGAINERVEELQPSRRTRVRQHQKLWVSLSEFEVLGNKDPEP